MPPVPEDERDRLLKVIAETTGKGTMTAEEFHAKLAARRPAAG